MTTDIPEVLITVTDLELQAGQAVKYILLIILIAGCLINLKKAIAVSGISRKVWRATLVILFLMIMIPVLKWILILHPREHPVQMDC